MPQLRESLDRPNRLRQHLSSHPKTQDIHRLNLKHNNSRPKGVKFVSRNVIYKNKKTRYVLPQKQLWLRQTDAEIEGCINHNGLKHRTDST